MPFEATRLNWKSIFCQLVSLLLVYALFLQLVPRVAVAAAPHGSKSSALTSGAPKSEQASSTLASFFNRTAGTLGTLFTPDPANLAPLALPSPTPANGIAVVRHAPSLNGNARVEGSLRQLTGESVTLNGGAVITSDLQVPGTPTLVLNGNPTFGGTIQGTGSAQPTGYQVTLNGSTSTLGHLITRTDPITLATVSAPPASAGTRSVTITAAGQSAGSFATLRDLTLNGNVGMYAVPPGTYRNFIANGGSGFVLGVSGASQPSTYNLSTLTLNGQSQFQVVGPIVLTLGGALILNASMGSSSNPTWINLQLSSGGVTLNGGSSLYAVAKAPAGTVIVNGNAQLIGTVACDRLTINGGGLLRLTESALPPVNQAPVVSAGSNQSITLPSAAALNGSASDDGLPQGSSVTVAWTKVSGPGNVTFANGSSAVTTASFSLAGTYVLRLTASDSQLTKSSDVTITVIPQNYPPTVSAGPDRTITLPASAMLNGSAGDDGLPAGSALSVSWSKVTGPGTVAFTSPNAATTNASFSVAGTYVLRLTASDTQLSNYDDVVVTVSPQNHAPTVNAGTDKSITLPATAALNGSVTDDGLPVGGTTTSTWSKVSGPGTVTFGNPGASATTAAFSVAGTYVLRLTASDTQLSAYDEVVVTVTPQNHAPTANAGPDQTITLPNTSSLNGSASDDGLPSGSTLTTSWSKVSGPGTVTFGNANVTVTTAAFSVAGTYVLRLTSSDSELSTTDEITITVIPENHAPAANAGTDQTITLPNTASLNGSFSDDGLPAGSSVTSAWSKVSGPGAVTFGSPNSVLTSATFSTAGTYVLRLTASDSQLSSSDDVQVTVIPENHAPTVDAGADQSITLPNTGSLNGSAGDDGLPAGSTLATTWSKVSGPGTVTFGNANVTVTTASFSVAGTYVLRLTASDSEISTSDDVVITVIPQNQPPTANAGPDQTITLPATATLTGTASDDGLPAGTSLSLTWTKVSGPGVVIFADPSAAATSASFSVAGGYVLRLTASDSQLSASDDVIVTVNAQNQPPTANAGPDQAINLPATASLNGSASDDGLPVGSTLATTWSKVSGPGTVSFGNANLTVTTASFSAPGTYVLKLTATDTELIAEDLVTITSNAVNQAPSANAGADQSITSPANSVNLNGTVADDGLPLGAPLNTLWSLVSASPVQAPRFFGDDFNDNNLDPAKWVTQTFFGAQITERNERLEFQPSPFQFGGGQFRSNGYLDVREHVVTFKYGGHDQTSSSQTIFNVHDDGGATNLFAIITGDSIQFYGDFFVEGQRHSNGVFVYDGSAPVWLRWRQSGISYFWETSSDGINWALRGSGDYFQAPTGSQYFRFDFSEDSRGPAVYIDDFAVTSPTWDAKAGPGTVTFDDPTSAETTAHFSGAGQYVLRLTASDSEFTSARDLTVTVNPANDAPVIDAGKDQTILLSQAANLRATVADEGLPAGSTATETWSVVSGPGSVVFANPNVPTTTATFDAPGYYVLRLTASDSQLTSSDDTTIRVVNSYDGLPGGIFVSGHDSDGHAGGEHDGVLIARAAVIIQRAIGYVSYDRPNPRILLVTDLRNPGADNGDPRQGLHNSGFHTFDVADYGSGQEGALDVHVVNFNNYDVVFVASSYGGWLRQDELDILNTRRAELINFVNNGGGLVALAESGGRLAPTSNYPGVTYDQFRFLPLYVSSVQLQEDEHGSKLTREGAAAGLTLESISANSTENYFTTTAGMDIFDLSAADHITTLGLRGRHIGAEGLGNDAPIVSAGPNQTITMPNAATLTGVTSDDGLPAGSSITSNWSKVSGPGTVTFGNPAVTVTTAAFSVAGTYVLELTASDGQLSASARLTVTVVSQLYAPVADFTTTGNAGVPPMTILDSASTNPSFPVANLFDNDRFSHWRSTTNAITDQVIKLQLTDARLPVLDHLRLQSNEGPNNLKDFEVLVSKTDADDGSFSSVLTATYANNPDLQEFVLPAGPTPARYVKLIARNNWGGDHIALATFEPMATGSVENIVSLLGQNNLALNQSPALFANGGTIFDFSPNDPGELSPTLILNYATNQGGWSARVTGDQYATIRLAGGKLYTLRGVRVMPWADFTSEVYLKDFEVWVSATTPDPAAFTKVLTAAAVPGTDLQEFLFPGGSVQARYVKFVPLTNYGNQPSRIMTKVFDVIVDNAGGVSSVSSKLSYEPNGDIYLNDGNRTTAWHSAYGQTSEQWVKLALRDRAIHKIYGVGITPDNSSFGTYGPRDFDVQVSTTTDDDASFSTVLSGTLTDSSQTQEFNLPDLIPARYVKFVWHNGYSANFIGVGETEVLGVPAQGSVLLDSSGENSSLETAEKALDLDPATRFWVTPVGQVTNQWLKLIMPGGELTNIDHVAMQPGWLSSSLPPSASSPKDFEVQVSTTNYDDASFSTVFSGTLDSSNTLQHFYFPVTAARYVRLLIKNNYGYERIALASFFVYSPDSESLDARFFDMSSDSDGQIVAYNWNFGDGETSTDGNPAHVYAQPGVYPVTLTTTDNDGLSSSKQISYHATTRYNADFNASPLTVYENTTSIDLKDLSGLLAQPEALHTWDFGNGSTFNQQQPTLIYTYPDSGTFNVTMTVGDPRAYLKSFTQQVIVKNHPPKADIADGTTVLWGENWTNNPTVVFDQSADDAQSLQGVWDFGDGQTLNCQNCTLGNAGATHAYAQPGTYTVSFTLTDKDGGTASDTATYVVNKRPTAFIFQNPQRQGETLTVRAQLVDTFVNQPLSSKAVQLFINGALFTATSNASGFVEVSVPYPSGTSIDIIRGTFAGDNLYANCDNAYQLPPTGSMPASDTPSNRGTDFGLAFPGNYNDINRLYLFITSQADTSGVVTACGTTQNYQVTANAITTVEIPRTCQQLTSDAVENFGIHVTSLQPVVVYGLNQRAQTSGAYLALPTSALGNDYYVLSYSNGSFNPSSQFSVVATADNTTVTITPSAATGTHPAGLPYTVTLNQYQSYLLKNTVTGLANDLTGSHVTADKPVAVFGSHMTATVPEEAVCCADHLVEQMPPVNTWGKRFVLIPSATRSRGDFFRFMAAYDNTAVYLNGARAATLRRGQFYEKLIKDSTEVISTEPILVGQYATSSYFDPATAGMADPYLTVVPPYTQFLDHYTIATPGTGFSINYVSIATPATAVGQITLDGSQIAANNFTPVGNSGFSSARIAISVGTHNLDGPQTFGVFVYGFAADEGYGYAGGMSLKPTVRGTNLALTPETSVHPVNTQACVNATLKDQDGNPRGGQSVNINVSGANTASQSVQTDAAGQAIYCYTGANAGSDSVAAVAATNTGNASSSATVIWAQSNQPPTVSAGADQTIALSSTASLQGSVSDDGLPSNTLNVSWSKFSGPGTVTFGNSSAAVTTAGFDVAGVYVLRLTASDTQLSASDDVQITVNPAGVNQPPTANAGPDQTVALNGNLISNPGNELQLINGEISGWTEVQGTSWTQGTSNSGSGFPAAQRGNAFFFAGDASQAELRQDVDVSAFAANIDAGTQQFELKAYMRSANESLPDDARVILEYRETTNSSLIGTLDSGQIASNADWHLTEETNAAPAGTRWIRVRLLATRNSGSTNDAFFDSIGLRPVGNAAVKLDGAISDDGLPSGSTLSASWSAVSGPAPVTFSNGNAAHASASFTTAGTYVLRLTASDGQLSASDDVTVTVNPANQPPVANAGANQTITLPASANLNGTATDDGQPSGSTVSVSWSKASGPGTVTFANATSPITTASFSAPGNYVLRLTADDSEYEASAAVTIMVNPEGTQVNQPPAVNPGSNQTISLPTDTVTLNGTATDDGLPAGSTLTVTWTRISGPGVVSFGNSNSAVTTAQFSAVGSYVLRLSASDGAYTSFAEVGVILNPQNQAPTVNAGPDQTTILSAGAQLDGSVGDDGLPAGSSLTTTWTTVSGPGTVTFDNPNVTITGAHFSVTGSYVLRLTASDGALSASDDLAVTVNENVAPPTVEITAPADGSSVTEPTIVTGSVSGGTWRLEYSLDSDDNANNRVWTTFATGNGPRANVSLGTLDPTMMLNGLFDIRLAATDSYGQTSRTSISVIVERNLKVGNFTVSFSDLNIPVAGVPMEVTRTYDSRDKRIGDFGFGWTMGLRNIRLEKARVIGLKWYETVSAEAFPNYCLEATGSHLVTVTFPGGKVFKFDASVSPHCQRFTPITGGTLTFTPLVGTHGTLEVVGSSDFQVDGSIPGPVNLVGFGGGVDIFNSSLFKFTAEDGTAYVIDQRTGLQSIADTNNNTVTVSAGGIVHSNGKSIAFTRDSLGRISSVTDPNGNSQTYTYDAHGDLVSYTDNENNTSTYSYDTTHRLLTIHDPRGIQPIRNDYDADGRLISHTDGFGKVITYTHDLPARTETITDRLGHPTVFEYDERGNVLRKTDARGGVTSFTYDANDNVLTETNALGKTTTYTYDANDHRTSITDSLNNVTQFTYNTLGKMLTLTDALNHVTTNTYSSAGNVLTTKDALNNTTSFGYSIFDGQRTSMTDALNNTTSYTYTSSYLTKETDALGDEATFTYDSNGNRASQTVKRTNALGQLESITTSYEYDKLNRLKKTTFTDGSFTQVEYNSIGQQSATIDQLGRRTEFTYDDMGRLTKTAYADGTFEETTYDAEGRRLTSKDRSGHVTSFTYDELGRLTRTTYPDSTFTSTTYDAAGQVLTTSDARNNVTTYFYDAAGRRTKVRNALNQETTFAYDANGSQLSMTDALSHTTSYEYDANNRRTKTTYADTTFDSASYDAVGRSVSKIDQAGKTTQFTYDAVGRLTKVKDALNQETTYAYNEIGQQLSQTDTNNHTTRFEYDQLGRRVKRILPAGQFETYSYDTGGNLQSKGDFNGKTTTFNYDVMRRLLSKVPDASLNQPTISYTYNTSGQRAKMNDASGATAYSYDARNRLSSKQTPSGTLSYTYNESGSLLTTRSSNANGVSVDYSYDALNRLATVKDNNLAALNGGITTYSYDTVGNLQSYLYPNGVTTSYNYNSLNRLTSMNATAPVSTLASYIYTLGAAGNRTAVTELSGRTVNYTYDDLYRLTSESIANDAHSINGTVSYEYDPVGNRLNRTSSVAPVPSQTSTYDANDRLTSDNYDNNGNTTSANNNSYAYDFENHLTSLNGGSAGYVYDGDGNRVAKTVGGITTNYLVDTNNPTGYSQVVDELQGGSVVKSFTYGHDLISQRIVGSTLSFYGYDGHGSVRILTDATAGVTDTCTYDAFGNLISHTGTTPNDYLDSGEQFDANLGFYYLRARYMNPSSGRFWTMDRAEGSVYDPATLHKYLYSNGDPVNRIDPSGRMSSEMLVGLAVASIIAAITVIGVVYKLTRPMPTRFVSFEWKNKWTFRNENLSIEEIQETKNLALESFRMAFVGFGVVVTNGQGGNRIIVDGFSGGSEVGMTPPLQNYSYVYYDDIRILADRIGHDCGIDERNEVLRGIGKGIGRVAAHEFGHQGFPTFTIHNTDDPNSYDYRDGGDTWALYYGELHWSERSLEGMRRDLAR
jgi:RHS repeat-associated protein